MANEIFPSYPSSFFGTEPPETQPAQVSLFRKIFGPVDFDPVREKTEKQAKRNHEAALLAASAMRDIAALSALEEKALDTSLIGSERYRAIADAYTESVVWAVKRKCKSGR